MRLFVSHRPKPAQPAAGEPAKRGRPPAPETLEAAAKRLEEERRAAGKVPELGGPEGPEPTRYGDWERKGICSDF